MTASALAPVRDRQTVAAGSVGGAPDTFPKFLLEHARVRAERPANREKDYGIWQSWSWAEVAAEVEALACGLAAMGFRRGDKLAIIGDDHPEAFSLMVRAYRKVSGRPDLEATEQQLDFEELLREIQKDDGP
jgi:long-chain acyl-CoA synthetase